MKAPKIRDLHDTSSLHHKIVGGILYFLCVICMILFVEFLITSIGEMLIDMGSAETRPNELKELLQDSTVTWFALAAGVSLVTSIFCLIYGIKSFKMSKNIKNHDSLTNYEKSKKSSK